MKPDGAVRREGALALALGSALLGVAGMRLVSDDLVGALVHDQRARPPPHPAKQPTARRAAPQPQGQMSAELRTRAATQKISWHRSASPLDNTRHKPLRR